MSRQQHQQSGRLAGATAIALLLCCREVSALQSGQLTAGDIDDNLNFDFYLNYKKQALSQYYGEQSQEQHPLPDVRLLDRVPVLVVDSNGNPFSNAIVEVRDDKDGVVFEIPASTNGRATIFPAIDFEQEEGQLQQQQQQQEEEGMAVAESRQQIVDDSRASWRIAARPPGGTCPDDCGEAGEIGLLTTYLQDEVNAKAGWTGADAVAVALPGTSSLPSQLDLALVLDTTGSMCDELSYLQAELRGVIASVVSNAQGNNVRGRRLQAVAQVPNQGQDRINTDVRVGLVAYRDHGDEYVVNTSPFTNTNAAIGKLSAESCNGGGDYPEAMDEALEAASDLQWADGNVARVAFLVADAPPHAKDYKRTLDAALELRKKGVRVYGIAASGVADEAEYMMRLMSLVTGARYTWLTDDSGIGNPHAEPKVKCYQVTRLDQLLVRLLRSELTGTRIEASEDEIIREVGHQEKGVCIVDFQPEEEDTTMPTKAPTGSPVLMPAKEGEGGDAGDLFITGSDEATAEVAAPEATVGDDADEAGKSGEGAADVGYGGMDLTESAGASFLSSNMLKVCLVTWFIGLHCFW